MTALTLSDGRTLDVRDTGGEPGAPVLLYHHGTPSSGLVAPVTLAAAAARGLRVVSWSRPGYGTSTRAPGRTVADVAADAVDVLDALGIESVVTAGWSGGGPHALACGALLPDRVLAVSVLAGVAPYAESRATLDWFDGMGQDNLDEFGATLDGEEAVRAHLEPELATYVAITADQIVAAMDSLLPAVDRPYLSDAFGDFLAQSFREAVAHGVDGWVDDDLAFAQPWGFDLGILDVPVSVWQGSEDLMVPFAHGRWLVDAVPSARPYLQQGEGHISIVVGQVDAILDDLVARGSA